MRRSGFAVLALTALILPLSATAATITVQTIFAIITSFSIKSITTG
jgi:hypothetical protein